MVETLGNDLNIEKSSLILDQIRIGLKKGSPSMISTLISLYITDFGGGKSVLQRLSARQKKYYQIEESIVSNI